MKKTKGLGLIFFCLRAMFNLILLIQAISAGLQSHYGIVSISNLEMSKGGDCLRQVGAWIGDDVWLQEILGMLDLLLQEVGSNVHSCCSVLFLSINPMNSGRLRLL